MLKLYTAGNSICTQKVFITLAEKGLAYDTHDIDLFRCEQFQPWYLKINPKGVVPALDHDGRIVIESSLICEYLDDVFPTRGRGTIFSKSTPMIDLIVLISDTAGAPARTTASPGSVISPMFGVSFTMTGVFANSTAQRCCGLG